MKPGYKTTEFYATAALMVAGLAGTLQGSLPAKWAVLAGSVSTSCYAIARGIPKAAAVLAPIVREIIAAWAKPAPAPVVVVPAAQPPPPAA